MDKAGQSIRERHGYYLLAKRKRLPSGSRIIIVKTAASRFKYIHKFKLLAARHRIPIKLRLSPSRSSEEASDALAAVARAKAGVVLTPGHSGTLVLYSGQIWVTSRSEAKSISPLLDGSVAQAAA